MLRRTQAADVAAILILTVFVALVGTGLGLAAAHMRAASSSQRAPLRVILRPTGADTPSIQRDRVRFHAPPSRR